MKITKHEAEVKVIKPEKVVIELSVVEAKVLGCIMGQTTNAQMQTFVSADLNGLGVSPSEIPIGFNFNLYDMIEGLLAERE